MPKSTKKSPVRAAKKTATKKPTALKAKAKSTARPALKAHAASKAPVKAAAHRPAKAKKQTKHAEPTHGRGFMWKLLEQKKQQQTLKASVIPGSRDEATKDDPRGAHGHQPGFSRFNGPRRKAA